MADKPHLVAKPVARDQALELLAIGVSPGASPAKMTTASSSAPLVQLGRRRDQVALPLDAGETRRLQHDLGAGQRRPIDSELLERLG